MNIQRMRKIIFDPLAWKLSQNEIRRLILSSNSIEDIIAATHRYQSRGFYDNIHAVQRESEISGLTRIVQQLQPKVIVEIGTYKGGTFFIWCRSSPQLDLIVSIDLPSSYFGKSYAQHRAKLYREFLFDRPHTQAAFLHNDSHAPATLQQLQTILNQQPIDFLYIDGDHTYSGVKQDFEMYSPLVRKGGIVAFHDIITRTEQHDVHILWNEIKSQFRHEELIENPTGKMGIGILYM